MVYAGFWRRLCAHIIDMVLLVFVLTMVDVVVAVVFHVQFGAVGSTTTSIPGQGFHHPPRLDPPVTAAAMIAGLSMYLFGVIVSWLYYAGMESSAMQATLGKNMLGIRVVDEDGRRIGFLRATGRYYLKIFSSLILFGGFIMIAFTDRKQALHDKMASTLVVLTGQ